MFLHGSIARGEGLEEGKLELWVWKGDGMGGPRQSLLFGTGEVLAFSSLEYRLDSSARIRDQPRSG